jgi:CBS domain-containing protein
MDRPIRRPEEILAYRPLKTILTAKPSAVLSVSPADSIQTALQLMSDKDTGFLVVLERDALVGVLSERDCARRVALAGKSPTTTKVADIMVRKVVTAQLSFTYAECLKLMHDNSIRHLPIIDRDRVVAVISIRDLLSEAVSHHAKIIAALELERMTIFTSTV